MRTLAGIVLYHPNMERLQENMDAVCEQVDGIVLVNNGPDDQELHMFASGYSNAVIIDNHDNLGIAAALGQIMNYAGENQYDWVLTLDQDSVSEPELVDRYLQYADLDHVGVLTCNIIDRNFVEEGLSGDAAWRAVRQCITAGAFMNVAAYQQTDGYDERMFIDEVDFDICINMRQHGFRIVRINYNGILHEVGHGRNVHILWREFISYNHPPFRHYYRARNTRYLALKYPQEYNILQVWGGELVQELIIVLYEENKMAKIRNRWRGLRDSKKLLRKDHMDTKMI